MTIKICNPSQLECKLRYPHNYEYKYHEDKFTDGTYAYVENGDAPPVYKYLCSQRISIVSKFYSEEHGNYCFEVKAESIFTNKHGIIQANSVTEICTMSILSAKNSIIRFLADKIGVSINELNYKYFVTFFEEFIKLNMDRLKIKKSTSKLGWNNNSFVPIDDDVSLDFSSDNGGFRNIARNIRSEGNLEKWKEIIKRYTGYKDFNFIIGTSMASILLKPLGIRSYTIIPRGASENGKTFATHCGLSIYGKPSFMKIGSFDTQNAILEKAYRYQNICLVVDDPYKKGNESKGIIDFYAIANEKNRGRLDKNSTLCKEKEWRLTSIITSESALIKDNAQAGEHNRVLEYFTKKIYKDEKVVKRDYKLLEENFGLVLPEVIDLLKKISYEDLNKVLYLIEDALNKSYDGRKLKSHISSVATSCLGSYMLNKYFLSTKKCEESLVSDAIDLGEFILNKLIDKKDSITGKVALEETYNFFSTNSNKFQKDVLNERYGTINESKIIFIIAPLKKYLEGLGYNFKDFKKYCLDNKLAEYKQLRINGVATWRLVLPMEQQNEKENENKNKTLYYTDFNSLEIKSMTIDFSDKTQIACLDSNIKYFTLENNQMAAFDLNEYVERNESVIEAMNEYEEEMEQRSAINRGEYLDNLIKENENEQLLEFVKETGELLDVVSVQPNKIYVNRKTFNITAPMFSISMHKLLYVENIKKLGVEIGESIENLILKLAAAENIEYG